MAPFTTLDAIACPLNLENVDTDQLLPARFMSRSRAVGYGDYLLRDLRFDAGGTRTGFILDQPPYVDTKIIIARRNFGTGSSREAAVYALWDFGIRCVIAPSFGDIFASNAVKNGLLPAEVGGDDVEALLADLGPSGASRLTVDLDQQRIVSATRSVPFVIDPVRRAQLLNGWDDLDLTLQHRAAIDAYRTQLVAERPWVMPRRT